MSTHVKDYDRDAVHRFWRLLGNTDRLFKRSADPAETVLDFLGNTYAAAADAAK